MIEINLAHINRKKIFLQVCGRKVSFYDHCSDGFIFDNGSGEEEDLTSISSLSVSILDIGLDKTGSEQSNGYYIYRENQRTSPLLWTLLKNT